MQTDSERRSGHDRRRSNMGPPAGVNDRRLILQRRMFNLGERSVDDWIASGSGFAWGKARYRE